MSEVFVGALLGLILTVAIFYGYVSNAVQFFELDFQAPYRAEVLRGVGLFIPPVGIFEGYMTIKDGEAPHAVSQ